MTKNAPFRDLSKKKVCRNISSCIPLLIILLCLLSYSRGLTGDFVFDDTVLIANDQFYKTESNPFKCWDRGFWSDGKGGLYRPAVIFSNWLNVKLFGLSSPMFRAVNLLLHMAVAFLVYLLVRKINLGQSCAIIASLLYAVHPLHSEAVIPAFGRAELLCAIFFILAFMFHIRKENFRSSAILAGIFSLLALWSKEHAVAFIPLCLLYDLSLGKIKDRKLILKYSVYIVCLGLLIFSKYSAMHTIFPYKDKNEALVDNSLALCNTSERVVSAVRIQGITLGKFVYPANLSHDYSYAQLLPSKSVYDVKALLTLTIFLGLPAWLIYSYQRRKMSVVFLVSAYAICVIPAGNFIIPAGTIFAERLSYIPSIWLCIFLSLAFIRLSKSIPPFLALFALISIISLLSYRSILRCNDWQNRMSLAVSGIKTSPLSIKTWGNLAVQFEEAGQYGEAIAACNIALGIYPDDPSVYLKRGTYYTRLMMNDDAEKDFRKALSMNPEYLQAKINLAIVLANTGKIESAKQILKEILQRYPSQTAASEMLESLEKH
ncbi:MAG: tetratricopeptide repeat protein [Victivallales bacterium]